MSAEEKLTLVMLSADFSLPPYGGIAAHLAGLCPALVRRGHNVTLVVPGYGRGDGAGEYEGVKLLFLRRGGGVRYIRYVRRLFSVRKALKDLVEQAGANLIHVHDLLAGPPIARGLRRRVPLVFTNHTSVYARWSEGRFGRMKLRLLVGKPDGIITVSPILLERSRIHRPTHLALISSGVDTGRFRPQQPDPQLAARLGLRGSERTALFVGRPAPVKGLQYLVKAFAEVKARIPGARLLVAGAGSRAEEEALRGDIAAAGLGGNVILLGRIDNEKLPGYYALADVVMLPSLMEATSIAGLEAMACGKPLIGTDVGGLPLIIDARRSGLLVPPADPKSLAEAIFELFTDEKARASMGAEGRRRAETLFSWEIVAARTEDFYRRVLKDRKKGPAL
jgi:glycosyltransferase involved in cell wall biosynthesis